MNRAIGIGVPSQVCRDVTFARMLFHQDPPPCRYFKIAVLGFRSSRSRNPPAQYADLLLGEVLIVDSRTRNSLRSSPTPRDRMPPSTRPRPAGVAERLRLGTLVYGAGPESTG